MFESFKEFTESSTVKWIMLLIIMVAVILCAIALFTQFIAKASEGTLDSYTSVRMSPLQQTSSGATKFATEGPSGSQTELTPYEARMLNVSKSSYADSLVGSRQDPLFMQRDDELSKALVSRSRLEETQNSNAPAKEGLENVRVRPLKGGERATEGQLANALGRGF